MSEEITQSLIAKINQAHQAAISQAQEAIKAGRGALQGAWEAGQYLIELKANTPHGEWLNLFDPKRKALADLNERTARNYMALAKKFPTQEELDSLNTHQLKDGYIACGIMPEPERTETQQGHDQGAATYVSYAAKLNQSLNRSLERTPLDAWPSQEKLALKATLKPLIDLYEQL